MTFLNGKNDFLCKTHRPKSSEIANSCNLSKKIGNPLKLLFMIPLKYKIVCTFVSNLDLNGKMPTTVKRNMVRIYHYIVRQRMETFRRKTKRFTTPPRLHVLTFTVSTFLLLPTHGFIWYWKVPPQLWVKVNNNCKMHFAS